MKNIFWSIAMLTLGFTPNLISQENSHKHSDIDHIHSEKCIQADMDARLRAKHPEWKKDIELAEKSLEELSRDFAVNKRSSRNVLYVIPIVFHVLHQNGTENISDAQILNQMEILNKDFNMLNEDLSTVVSQFVGRIGNAQIEFRLAQTDPQGNPTNGIDRIFTTQTNVGDDNSKLNPWPRDRYLNVWTANQINGAAGAAAYAYLPPSVNNAGAANIDGIITNHRYVGSIGTSQISRQHTLSHEIGHFLNLLHPWGPTNTPNLQSNCGTDDGVTDTPNTIGTLGTCNTSQITCGSLDNIQNIMDYASCDCMFTQGQVARMHATLNSSVAQRSNLWTQSNLVAAGVANLNRANFKAIKPYVCQGQDVQFIDLSTYGPSSWNWTFSGVSTSNSTQKNPLVKFNYAGGQNVVLNVKQGASDLTASKTNYIVVSPTVGYTAPYTETFASISSLPSPRWAVDNSTYETFQGKGWILSETGGFNGGKCAKLDNYGASVGLNHELISAAFDLSVYTSATLSFKYAYARRQANDNDRMFVHVSTDCGETWTPRYTLNLANSATAGFVSASYTPIGNQEWQTVTLNPFQPSLLQKNVMFRFTFLTNGGNNLYLDDINISGDFSTTAQLEYPYDGLINRSPNTTLSWKPMQCQSYEVQLASDANFNTIVRSETKTFVALADGADNSLDLNGLTNGATYYWRVRLVIGGTPQAWSEEWSFTVAPNGVGIESQEIIDLNLSLYPNPTNHTSTLQFMLNEALTTNIKVYDMHGRIVFESQDNQFPQGIHKIEIPSQNWAKGMYAVSMTLNGNLVTRKLIVK